MNILKSVFAVFTASLICTPAYAEEVTQFKDIMALMEGAKITYERIGKYERPFKVTKKGDRWILKQMKNFKKSPIKDAGKNKISVNGFPSNWTVNGTWSFKKAGSKCRIDHNGGGMVMRWNCGG